MADNACMYNKGQGYAVPVCTSNHQEIRYYLMVCSVVHRGIGISGDIIQCIHDVCKTILIMCPYT